MSHHAKALVLSCMDYRFQEAIADFCRELRIAGSCDYLAVAGSALNITRPNQEQDRAFITGQIEKSLRLHAITQVVIINHQNCGAYGEFDLESTEKVQHYADLKKAAKIIQDHCPELKVKLYFANLKEKGSKREIEFEEVK